MRIKNYIFLSSILAIFSNAYAFEENGWDISNANAWRLVQDRSSQIGQESSSKLLTIEEAIVHRSASYTDNKNFVNSYTFSVGCSISSKTPIYRLRFSGLDISLNSLNNGYAFARFLVDEKQEISLRGKISGSSIINFYPFTESQEKAISNIFLQLREGSVLKIALLQGETMEPKVYEIPLNGFSALSENVIKDCNTLHSFANASGKSFKYLDDYLSLEPKNAAPEGYTLMPKEEDDTKAHNPVITTKEEVKEEAQNIENKKIEEKPKVHTFEPDGGIASIGPDGMPIGVNDKKEETNTITDDNEVKDKSLEFDGEGNPIFN